MVGQDAQIRVKGKGQHVSRGGYKMAYALEDFGLGDKVKKIVALDVGASTGGFTDCLLQAGSKKFTPWMLEPINSIGS